MDRPFWKIWINFSSNLGLKMLKMKMHFRKMVMGIFIVMFLPLGAFAEKITFLTPS